MTKISLSVAIAIVILTLSACSESPSKSAGNGTTAKANEASSSEPVTAKAAYWQMYQSAYKWTPDFVMLALRPKEIAGFTSRNGKAEVWQATFASPGKHQVRVFTYAVTAHPPDISKGVSVGNGIPWGGMTRDVMPIEKSAFNVDSDAAYAAAAADAASWLAKNSNKKLSSFQLGNSNNFPAPVWYVVWGDKKSGYAAFVDATTGKVLKKAASAKAPPA